MISRLKPISFDDYELIDCGDGYKLERFGAFTLLRPEPQALWRLDKPFEQCKKTCHAYFERDKNNSEKGLWTLKKGMLEQWKISYKLPTQAISFRLGLTAFKHIGIFPEQSSNWNYIFDQVTMLRKNTETPKILNLFAYTGGASLAAKAAGADVTHVDSVKQVINWTNENMKNSNLDNIRWVVEDALKFAQREVKRGVKYHGIVLDPPAYGRGPDGERWILESLINELLQNCSKIVDKKNYFVILNLYSMGFSSMLAETLLKSHFSDSIEVESGDLYAEDSFGKKLPLSIFCRFSQSI